MLLAVVTTAVAAARVYSRRHWPSDVLGTAALAVGYGGLVMLNPDRRWRRWFTAAAIVALGAVHVAWGHGITIAIPAGTVASRRAPVTRIDFDAAYRAGLLHGPWSPDEADRQHHGVWLLGPTGELGLGRVDAAVSELRLVLRPRGDGRGNPRSCHRLRVTLNDRMLGERLLHPGWQSYVFSTAASDFRRDGNVVIVEVHREPSEERADERRALFVQLGLHAATALSAADTR